MEHWRGRSDEAFQFWWRDCAALFYPYPYPDDRVYDTLLFKLQEPWFQVMFEGKEIFVMSKHKGGGLWEYGFVSEPDETTKIKLALLS